MLNIGSYGLLILLLVGCTLLKAQTPERWVPFEEAGKWGYRDERGRCAIGPQFVLANEFSSEGIAAVIDKEGWLYIDMGGDPVIRPYVFDNGPDYFREGLARFTANEKFGFFDEAGQVVVEPQFDFALPFSEGLSAICMGCIHRSEGEHTYREGGTWGYIDMTGREVIPLQFEDARGFEHGLADVKMDGVWMHIDKQGDATPAQPPIAFQVEGKTPGRAEEVEGRGLDMRKEWPDQPEQKVVDLEGRDVTGEYVSACRRAFRRCLQEVFLNVARGVLQDEESIAEREMDRALACHEEYFQALKGGTNVAEDDVRAALIQEERRQHAFYRSLRVLCRRFEEQGVQLDIAEPGYYDSEILWNTGPSAGCRIVIQEDASLYASPLAPSYTDEYMVLRAGPVAADVLFLNTALMLFIRHDEDPEDRFWEAAETVFGTPTDITDQVPNVHTARLLSGFLELSVMEDIADAELERLQVKYGVAAVLRGDPHALRAVIYTGREHMPPVLLRELSD